MHHVSLMFPQDAAHTPSLIRAKYRAISVLIGLVTLASLSAPLLSQDDEEGHGPPPLAIGAAAPDFCLSGVDGQNHCLKDYASAKALMIAFLCNHCPTSQLYETRVKQIVDDYKGRGVAVVAIEPNNPNAVRLDEMGYTDVGDSFEEMKIRAEYRHFNFPYLYDGEDQKISNMYGPTATPHVFIFDAQRKLRYEGRIDNNPREPLVTRRDARLALDASMRCSGAKRASLSRPCASAAAKALPRSSNRHNRNLNCGVSHG